MKMLQKFLEQKENLIYSSQKFHRAKHFVSLSQDPSSTGKCFIAWVRSESKLANPSNINFIIFPLSDASSSKCFAFFIS